MSTSETYRATSDRGKLLRTTLMLLAFSFAALVGVQLADVTLTDAPAADLILAIWATQSAALVWALWLRLERVHLGWSLAALLLFETGWAFLFFTCVPWRLLAGEAQEPPPAVHAPPRRSAEAPVTLDETSPFDWPAFRGAQRDGRVAGVRLAADWPTAGPSEVWRQPVGAGWSSFAVVGDYCFTQEQRGESETVVCYELATGRECWVHRDDGVFHGYPGGDYGPRATPAVVGGCVYSLGALGVLNCLDATNGEARWSVDILADNNTHNCHYGMCGSPLVLDDLVLDDLVFVSPGGAGASLVAYDAESGAKVWSAGDDQGSYSSPQPAVIGGRRQVLLLSGDSLSGHRLEDGKVTWSYPWVSNPDEKNNVCQPVVLPTAKERVTRVFIASGYGQGCVLLEITRQGDEFALREVWSNRNLKAKFSSVVVRDGFVYGLDERILVCLDLETGQRRWKQGRYGFGQLILIDDVLLVQAESGDVALVGADPSAYEEFARFSPLSNRTWNHPVVAGSRLLVRNASEAACYELPLAGKMGDSSIREAEFNEAEFNEAGR
ncbi:MAG: PQQ-binding-like beta-propeller repeat protein [Pirellulaceae bacterium]